MPRLPRRTLAAPFITLLSFAPALHAQTLTLSRVDIPSFAGARAVATADLDRNGWPDIVHANAGRDSLTVLLNKGAGGAGFVRAFDIPVGHGPFDLAVADFNRDGIPDLAVANADGDSISVLVGRGDGSFSRTDLAAPGNPRGLAAGDTNGDGRPDIVYTAYATNTIVQLIGNGTGGFTKGLEVTGFAQRPQGVAIADFNNDGRSDYAVAYATPGPGLAIFYNGATPPQFVSGPENLNLIATGDFDGDGWQDVAAVSTGNSRLSVYLGSATGLRFVKSYATGVSPRGVQAADVTHDGRLDLVTANKESSTVTVFAGRRDLPGAFSATEFASGGGSRAVAIADFDYDGRLDLATGNQDAATATVLWNETLFVRPGLSFTFTPDAAFDGVFSDIALVADLNHNGRPDRFLTGGGVILDDGTQVPLPIACRPPMLVDVNRDGHLDAPCLSNRAAVVMFGDGRGRFTAPKTIAAWSGIVVQEMVAYDANRDGRVDLAVSTYESGSGPTTLHLLVGRGDGTFQPEVATSLPVALFHIVPADLDRDGNVDLLGSPFRGPSGSQLYVFFADGGGRFIRTNEYVLPDIMNDFEIADVNEDGKPDVVGATFNAIFVLLGTSGGVLTPPKQHPSSAYRLSLGDINQDGHIDIVSNGAVDVWFGFGDGTFGAPQGFVPYGYDPTPADMNGDGVVDIVLGGLSGILYGQRNDTNRAPIADAGPDIRVSYHDVFNEDDDNMIFVGIEGRSLDPDQHRLTYQWFDADGTLIAASQYLLVPRFTPGTYPLTLRVADGRGASADDHVTLTIDPIPELVLHAVPSTRNGTWSHVVDSTAASGVRAFDPDKGAPKVTAPLANPANYIEIWFVADPTQTYKLWVRGKAQNDDWANDSAWIQFDRSLTASGAPAYRIGTTSALPFNLEECSGCGIAGWGWEDDGWGAVNANGTLLRFEGGWQRLRIQTREDGLSVDQIVLSAGTYRTTRPGRAKNDTTILARRER